MDFAWQVASTTPGWQTGWFLCAHLLPTTRSNMRLRYWLLQLWTGCLPNWSRVFRDDHLTRGFSPGEPNLCCTSSVYVDNITRQCIPHSNKLCPRWRRSVNVSHYLIRGSILSFSLRYQCVPASTTMDAVGLQKPAYLPPSMFHSFPGCLHPGRSLPPTPRNVDRCFSYARSIFTINVHMQASENVFKHIFNDWEIHVLHDI